MRGGEWGAEGGCWKGEEKTDFFLRGLAEGHFLFPPFSCFLPPLPLPCPRPFLPPSQLLSLSISLMYPSLISAIKTFFTGGEKGKEEEEKEGEREKEAEVEREGEDM